MTNLRVRRRKTSQKRSEDVASRPFVRVCLKETLRAAGKSSKPGDQSTQTRVTEYPVVGANLDILKAQHAHSNSDEPGDLNCRELLDDSYFRQPQYVDLLALLSRRNWTADGHCVRLFCSYFSSAAANASRDNERSRFRRMPRSTSANRSEAAVIHSKSADSANRSNSEPMSVFRINSGAPESMNTRSRNSE